MPPKIIKLGKKDDIASAIKHIKDLREREVVFELTKGSSLLSSSDNLKLLKRTGEALGKKVLVETDDEIGRILAKKAGVLSGDAEVKMPRGTTIRVARSDVKPRFSDILGSRRVLNRAQEQIQNIVPVILPKVSLPKLKIPGGFWPKVLIASGVVLILAAIALAIFLPKAIITVFARSEQISRDMEITVDKNTTKVDSDNLQIAGIPVSKEVSQTKSFAATGTRTTGTKASGSVVLYNFTTHTLTLRASTTTLVANGKKYSFAKDVTGIKPTTSEATPSTAAIIIVAEQAGEAYNLPANTKFQIVNSALGNQNVYAKNPEAISGGATTATGAKILSQQDLDQAAVELAKAALAQLEADLTLEKGSLVRLVPSGVKQEVLTKTANKNVGDQTESFSMTLIAKITGLAFKDEDVSFVVISKINQVLSADKYLLADAKKEYTAEFKSIDIPNAHGVLGVHFQTLAAYKVDSDNLAKILSGKNENEIKEILLSKPEIDKVKVEFWPAWFVHKAPRFNGRIKINTVLQQ